MGLEGLAIGGGAGLLACDSACGATDGGMGGSLDRFDADGGLPTRAADGTGWGRIGATRLGVVAAGSKPRCDSSDAGSGLGDSSEFVAGTSVDVGTFVAVGGAMPVGCLGVAKAGIRGWVPLSLIGDCGLAGRIIAGVVGATVPRFGVGECGTFAGSVVTDLACSNVGESAARGAIGSWSPAAVAPGGASDGEGSAGAT